MKLPSSAHLSKGEGAFTELKESGKLGWDAPSLTMTGPCCLLFVCLFACERQVLPVRSSLVWNSLCSPDHPQCLDNPPASASHHGSQGSLDRCVVFVLMSYVCITIVHLAFFILSFRRASVWVVLTLNLPQSKKLSSLVFDCCFSSS